MLGGRLTGDDAGLSGRMRAVTARATLAEVVREWGRIGCIGFGGPPAHVALLRELCVERRRWLDAREFEDAYAACALLPGPASTQLAIFCAQRVAGLRGAVAGGLAFILPGLILVIALAAVSLQHSPPDWIRGMGAAAGAAAVAVVGQAGIALARASLANGTGAPRWRMLAYLAAGATAAALFGAGVVLVLLGCGLVELAVRRGGVALHAWPVALAVAAKGAAALPPLAWTAFKVGGLSFGGGYVIIPLMQADAVDHTQWMTHAQFLNGVALGQLTPGPVTHTVAVVGYAAAGVVGGVVAATVAFTPSFAFVLLGARHFERLRRSARVRAFLGGAGPAAIGAILGSAIPLAREIQHVWQAVVFAGAVASLFALRRGVVATLLAAGVVGVGAALLGASTP
jgi:chromate transporter